MNASIDNKTLDSGITSLHIKLCEEVNEDERKRVAHHFNDTCPEGYDYLISVLCM